MTNATRVVNKVERFLKGGVALAIASYFTSEMTPRVLVELERNGTLDRDKTEIVISASASGVEFSAPTQGL